MFSNFRIWPTTRDEMRPARAKSHRARVAPYPTRLPIEDGHPLMPLQSKVSISDLLNAIAKLTILEVPKPMLNFETTEVLDPPVLSPGPSEDLQSKVSISDIECNCQTYNFGGSK